MKNIIINLTKRCLLALVSVAATVHIASAQSWTPVGSPGFGPAGTNQVSMAIDPSGTQYVAFADHSVSPSVATVMVYNSSAGWTTLGSPLGSTADNVSIAIDPCGIPYAVFEDGAYGGAATVMTYDGSRWVPVGSPGFSAGAVQFPSVATDPDGVPYVAYQDLSSETGGVTVMKFDGSSWVTVGSPGFSAGAAQFVTLQLDNGGVPYVAFQDMSTRPSSVTVMQYTADAGWTVVGMPGFSFGEADWPYLTLDGSGTPYVVFEDGTFGGAATVMTFDGDSWKYVGVPGFSASSVSQTTMAMGSGIPYVSYLDGATGGITVMQFTDAGWVPFVGPVTSGGGGSPRIVVNATTVSVAYIDPAVLWAPTVVFFEVTFSPLCCSGTICGIVYFYDAAGNRTYRTDTCIYWSGDPTSRHSAGAPVDSVTNSHHSVSSLASSAVTASIYPNPTSNTATITASQPLSDATVTVMYINGAVLSQKKMSGKSSTIDLSQFAPGTYMVMVRNSAVNFVFKVEKL